MKLTTITQITLDGVVQGNGGASEEDRRNGFERGGWALGAGELKARPGGELQVHGSGTLVRWLLAHGLVDELTLLVVPVILGQGARLFPETGPDLALDVVESRVDTKGVSVQVHRPAGRPRYSTA
ncbi:dihydrofolate reductase family protein [Amycolatopsis sp. H6(2020)]|nr:dihydrofolate reductase family protein [Amycolatopsis sp. H6(2020)]